MTARLVLISLLVITGFLQAQDQKRSIKFSCVVWEEISLKEIYYRSGKEFHLINLFPGNRSDEYELKGAAELELYTIEVTDSGKKGYNLVGKGNIPAGADRVLYFLNEVKGDDKVTLKLMAIDDSLSEFPRGAARFLNLTKTPLYVEFSGKSKVIKPKGMTVFKSNVEENGALLPFFLKNAKKENLYENRYFAQEIGRDMFFILPPSKAGGRVNIKLLPHLMAKPTPQ